MGGIGNEGGVEVFSGAVLERVIGMEEAGGSHVPGRKENDWKGRIRKEGGCLLREFSGPSFLKPCRGYGTSILF